MTAAILMHPTLVPIAAECMDLIHRSDVPLNDERLAMLTGQPIQSVRVALQFLWDKQEISPIGTDSWTRWL